ncbi:MAG: hypothetical protein AAFY88_30375, partial [Acidobacteriota bacterium]
MKHLALLGEGTRLLEIAGHLHGAGFAVTLLPSPANDGEGSHGLVTALTRPGLALASTARSGELAALASTAEWHGLPWLFLCGDSPSADSGGLTTAAYEAGALAVLPASSETELVVQAVERSVQSLTARGAGKRRPLRRSYRSGDTIPLATSEKLYVMDGVVAQIAWHGDGGEGLVGLWGPGHLLTGHPADACGLALRAHTDATVEVERLDPLEAGRRDSVEPLLARVRGLEAWSSVQTRQNMQERLLGILTLLAEQFGAVRAEGTL